MTDRPTQPDEALIARLFAQLDQPQIPAELQADSFLDGIYQRAAAAETASLGPILDAAMTPIPVPDEDRPEAPGWNTVAWREPEADESRIRPQAVAALPQDPGPAPAMLWTRIRADIQGHRAARRRRSAQVWMRRAAAAILIGASLVGFLRFGSTYFDPNGTTKDAHFVFREGPGQDSFSLDRILGR